MKYFPIFKDRPYPPALMVLATRATVLGFSKIFPSKIKSGYSSWKNGRNMYFYKNLEYEKTIDDLIKKAEKDQSFLQKYFLLALEKAKKLRIFSQKYKGKNISKTPLEELLNYYCKFNDIFFEMYTYGTVANLIGYRDDNSLYIKARKILQKKTAKYPEKFADYFSILTSPHKRFKTRDFDLAVLKLAKIVKKNNLFCKSDIEKRFKKEIKDLADKFEWLSYDFSDKVDWDKEYYINLIKQYLNSDLDKKIRENVNYEEEIKKKFKQIAKKLKLSKKEVKVFKLISDIGTYKWLREYEFQEALYNLGFIQKEIGRRFGLDGLETKYILPEEFDNLDRKAAQKIVKERMNCSLFYSDFKKGDKFFVGKEAKRKLEKINFITDKKAIFSKKSIKGMPAQAGKAKGIAKIINEKKETKKMNQGDVLVSVATSPDLLPAMKKAEAIITDEGGITCHAAIVSRELGIPCIVGTKIATQILRDGDKVEVDAEKGIVKIISKK